MGYIQWFPWFFSEVMLNLTISISEKATSDSFQLYDSHFCRKIWTEHINNKRPRWGKLLSFYLPVFRSKKINWKAYFHQTWITMNESSITASKALFARYHFHRSPGCTPTTDPTKSDPLVANGTEASATVAEASAPGVETAPGSDRPSERRRGRRRLVPKVYLRLVLRSLLRTRRNNPKEPHDMLIKVAVLREGTLEFCLTQSYCSLGILRLATMATISKSYTTPRLDRWQKGVFKAVNFCNKTSMAKRCKEIVLFKVFQTTVSSSTSAAFLDYSTFYMCIYYILRWCMYICIYYILYIIYYINIYIYFIS